MTRVLVVGAGGQLGGELLRVGWGSNVDVVGRASDQLDITDAAAVKDAVSELAPSVIVNAAAYTAVDRAEQESDLAFAVNHVGVENLAAAADAVDGLLIHLSTDYVFDGSKQGWYVESDRLAPLGVYGRSKAAGERAALDCERSVILRTAWVYGALGANFVTTMLRLAKERDELRVVGDQVGCPTATADLAHAIATIAAYCTAGTEVPPQRLYHLASPSQATWYEFACAIFAASTAGFDGSCIEISTAEYPTPAQRPANSRLSCEAIEHDLGIRLPPWQESIAGVVAELERDV